MAAQRLQGGDGGIPLDQRRVGFLRQDCPLDSGIIIAVEAQEIQRPLQRCLLYTSDAADDLLCVDLGGRHIIKKKKNTNIS